MYRRRHKMKNRILPLAILLMAGLHLGACSTTSSVIVNKSVEKAKYSSVYIVSHGGSSADMDADMQREFLRHGLAVTTGPEGAAMANVDLVARYTDDWKWDMAMYLWRLDVMLFDRKTNTLLASGSWKNSTLHGFYGSEKVVANVVDETLSKVMIAP
jgi:hypothetical protein